MGVVLLPSGCLPPRRVFAQSILMNRPPLHAIPLTSVTFAPGTVTFTLSRDQWDNLLAAAYEQGHTLLELDADEKPVAAYRKCSCDICRAMVRQQSRAGAAQQAGRASVGGEWTPGGGWEPYRGPEHARHMAEFQ